MYDASIGQWNEVDASRPAAKRTQQTPSKRKMGLAPPKTNSNLRLNQSAVPVPFLRAKLASGCPVSVSKATLSTSGVSPAIRAKKGTGTEGVLFLKLTTPNQLGASPFFDFPKWPAAK
jgi:hypothetical protein